MNPKKLVPFAIAIGVLIIVLAIIKGPSKVKKISEEARLQVVIPASLRPATVQKMEISSSEGKQLTLVKNKDTWQIATLFDAPADQAKLEKFLESLSGLMGEERSDSAEVLADYELDEAKAGQLKIFDAANQEKPAVFLFIGKSLGYQNSFVRHQDQNKVFLVNIDFQAELGFKEEDNERRQNNWAEKTITHLDRDKISKISLKSPKGSLNLIKEIEAMATPAKPKDATPLAAAAPLPAQTKTTWRIEGKEVPMANINPILGYVSAFPATQVLDPAKAAELGLATPTHTLEIVLENGESKTLTAKKDKEKNIYYLKTPAQNVIYQAEEYIFNQVFKSKQELLAKD